ncbi:MAG: hypothetical protein IPI24_12405 [Ignavibacteria bacterium]|nr:hypothetical protein [Ignavibacteria bacterium]
MAKRTTTRVTQRVLTQDKQIATAVLTLKDYNPANKEFTAQRLREALKELEEATAAEQKALEAVAKAREVSVRIEGEFHELVLGTKRQVLAQYGDDSDEITRLGMKKKSERKYGRPRKGASGERS